MDVIILAGGFGTRLSEYTDVTPKPMIEIGGKPILLHIIDQYSKYKISNFYIAMGYKSEVIVKYFLKNKYSEEICKQEIIKVSDYNKEYINKKIDIRLVQTGKDTMTGGRVRRMKKFIDSENFMVTYGDGISNVNIDKLLEFHKSHSKIGTVTGVRPPARFGELEILDNLVISFKEKPQMQKGWINGGFFIFKKTFFDQIESDKTLLEREPLEKLTANKELLAFKHEGFWQCMDNKRDYDLLQKIWVNNNKSWQ
tara:strand:+ start:205 stop:966 length:762 start_codon:yes stop_codon:yes gene_type:complete